VIPKPFVTRFLEQLHDGQLDRQQALTLCEENGSPVAQVFAGAVRKWGRPSVEVEQGVIDAGERATNGLRQYLRIFYGVATVGPLLGLMGTVLGMIESFNAIAASDALGRTAMLASGIAKALLNTAGGLAVAIPGSILYVFFISRIDRLVMDIDKEAQEVIHTISAEELQARRSAVPKPHRTGSSVTAS
jgi:biopolymer transport protein ExbB